MSGYTIKRYYSGFNVFVIEARDTAEAVEKARELQLNKNELLSNIEPWTAADEVEIN